MTAPFLAIQAVTKAYGTTVAVDDISLTIREGEFVTFLGPSGSGKSTTLYLIAGFQQPTSGDVLMRGASILDVPANKRNIGMVFQRYTLFPHLSVAENVAFPLRVRRQPDAEVAAKVAAMLKLVRLDGLGARKPAELSGGQQQRVALARALAYDPPLLLMDEPLSALDKKLRDELQFEIKRIHRETGVTILYVTHDQEEALRLSDRIALFNSGRIEQVGTGRDLYEAPATRFVAGFIGNSNFIAGKVVRAGARDGEMALPDGTRLTGLALGGLEPGDRASIMVRPDQISIVPVANPVPANGLAVTVLDTTFLGDAIHMRTRTGWGSELSLRQPARALTGPLPAVGDRLTLTWPAEMSRVYPDSDG